MSIKKLINEVLQEARVWDKKYLNLTLHAIRNFQSEQDAEELIEWFLSRESVSHFNSANPHSKDMFLAELLPKLLQHISGDSDDPDQKFVMSCAMGTFLRPEWDFPEGHIDFDIGKAKKIVRNALSGFNHISRFEPVTYQNEFCTKGNVRAPLVCFHCHSLMWTTASYSQLERLRSSLKYRFRSDRSRDDGPHFSRLQDPRSVATELAYISKMPTLGKRMVERGGLPPLQKSRTISYRSYNHMFNELRKHDMYTLWLSGGDGAKLLREARSRLDKAKDAGSDRKFKGRVKPGEPGRRRYGID